MAGREIPELRDNMPALPVKRAPRTTQSKEEGEGPVLAAVGELLALHPKVLYAVRHNSGAAFYEVNGKKIPVKFYRLIRTPEDLTIVDYFGFLTDRRPYCFECKRPSWSHPSSDYELRQWAFINMIVKQCGGIGSFVRSVDEVNALLP